MGFAYVTWWTALLLSPAFRPSFFGSESDLPVWLLVVDSLTAGACVVIGWQLLARRPVSKAVLALATLGVGVGTAEALRLAIIDPTLSLGVLVMLVAITLVIGIWIALAGISIVWGPFRFIMSGSGDEGSNWRQTIGQIVVMWGLFLVLIPLALASAERALGWAQFDWTGKAWVGLGLAAAMGGIGILASKTMVSTGGGTPLPSKGCRDLVTTGLYAHIRNPMAMTGIAQGVGVGVAMGSWLIITYAVCGALLWDLCVRPLEERHLQDCFGETYRRYRMAVPCWWCRLKPYRSADPTQSQTS
ncbi:MAG: hypothetical protein HONBIEJF_01807 [Fimbriimonadaceae bacterium]|nr:hypothetical protein [Fimbriimonadaceae bacterium]